MENVIGKLRRKSRLAAGEVQALFERDGEPYSSVLEFNLYVTRSIEAEISETLDVVRRTNGDAVSILVKGDAGYGKTSLAWHLYQSLKEADVWEPWFVKASQFSLGDSEGNSRKSDKYSVSAAVLKMAVAEAHSLKRFPVLLLDTVDLLLHGSADERDYLRETLLELLEMRCSLVITCRPQEAHWLKILRGAEANYKSSYKPPDLKKYDQVEFPQAIEKHVRFFYPDPAELTIEEHIAHIENLAAREYSFKEICRVPLALRMLFELYKNRKIVNSEVNIFGLYRNYWRNKVESDWRAGHSEPTDPSNLSETAGLTALAMLAEGSPIIDREKLTSWITRVGGKPDEVEKLRSRGLLQLEHHDGIEFFHQTFFEHSAARGLWAHFGARGLDLIEERLKEQIDDLFLLPIYEQALLLAAREAGFEKQFDESVSKLLDSASQIEQSSAVYVYVHAHRGSADVSAKVRHFLRAANSELVKRFLVLAPNMPASRSESLMAEISVVWSRNNWTEQTYVLDLLENLAAYNPDEVWFFLIQNRVGAYLLEINKKDQLKQAGGRWLKILIALSTRTPEKVWAEVINLYRHTDSVRQHDLLIKIFHFLTENVERFGASKIADWLAANSPDYLNKKNSYFRQELPKAYGALLSRHWQANNVTLNSILNDVSGANFSQTANEFQLRARLHALAFLMQTRSGEIENFFHFIQNLTDKDLQSKIILTVLPILIAGNADESVTQIVREKVKEVLRLGAMNLLDSASTLSGDEWHFFSLVREALRQGELPSPDLVEMLDFTEMEKLNLWQDENCFGMFLVDAARGNHPSAKEAMDRLTIDPQTYSNKLVQNVSSKLVQLAIAGENLAIWHVPLVLKSNQLGEASALACTLSFLSVSEGESFRQYADLAVNFKNSLIKSKSEKLRRAGYGLWNELLRLMLIQPPTLGDLLGHLEKENDEIVRAQIISLLSRGNPAGDEIRARAELLLGFAVGEYPQRVRDNALTALIELVAETPNCPEDLIFEALRASLTPPADARRVSVFGYVISSLIESRVELAADLLLKVLTSETLNSFQSQAKKNVANRLRSTIRALVREAPQSLRSRLIEQVPSLDKTPQHAIVEALFHESHSEMAEELNRLSLHKLHPKTNELIRRHKEARKSGSAWMELYRRIDFTESSSFVEGQSKFDGRMIMKINEAFLDAFRRKAELEQLVRFGINENLDLIAGGSDLREITFNLIQWAESCGKLRELLKAARQQNTGNVRLSEIVQTLLGE